jgi:hypothetical protein
MNHTWTLLSGGKLASRPVSDYSFQLNHNPEPDTALFTNEQTLRSFERQLLIELSARDLHPSEDPALIMEYRSEIVSLPGTEEQIEFLFTVRKKSEGPVLWYFILISPRRAVSSLNMLEIATLVAEHLPIRKGE